MIEITYTKGDATRPQTSGVKIIAHICNDLGGWGKGFVLSISKRWPEPEIEYRKWYRNKAKNNFKLGAVQIVQVEKYIHIANMVGQHGIRTVGDFRPPIRYNAVEGCLKILEKRTKELYGSIHMPRIGTGLAGGKWEKIEPLIHDTLCKNDIPVYVYDYKE